jgi:hypothetical protein
MAETRPESWLGEIVMVALSTRNPKEFAGRLDEVNDRGVILSLNPDSMNEVEAFYPWGAVRRLRLRSKKEKMAARSGAEPDNRLPGDPGWFS